MGRGAAPPARAAAAALAGALLAAAQCPGDFNVTEGASCPDAPSITEKTTKTADDCCAACASHGEDCLTWIWYSKDESCKIEGACPALKMGPKKSTGTRAAVPTPAPPPGTPAPLPPPVPSGSQKNVVLLLSDDQDLMHGSMVAMPHHMQLIKGGGANMSNFFVNTPICCPSRTTLLSGRWNHNNKVDSFDDRSSGCMRMNTSRDDNPAFWDDSFVSRLHDRHGYATGLFGKVLNTMNTYGCSKGYTIPHVDRIFVMCNHNFFNEKWGDQLGPYSPTGVPGETLNVTGERPEDYTTSMIGNVSLAWVRSVVESGPDHPPFFAYLGPHAPHKPSTPAPWYVDHPVGNTPVSQEPFFNYQGVGKHAFIPDEPPIDGTDLKAIQAEYANRLRTLLSVDDIVLGFREYLMSVGEWDRTFWFFTSDHGYNLGQYRIDSDKTQVYDHSTRVPMLIRGPGVAPGTELPLVSSMADLAPTILELAAGAGSAEGMDGTSFAPQLLGSAAAFPRTATLIEYQPGRKNNACGKMLDPECTPARPDVPACQPVNITSCHWHDGPNNTFAALRIVSPALGNLLYGEFFDGTDPRSWGYADGAANHYELYDSATDYYQLHNIYAAAEQGLKDALHAALRSAVTCKGSADCNAYLNL